jgi:puromycin-sensitive aminopeptidase
VSTNPHRLPRTALPRRYDLRLDPDLDSFTFRGSEQIAIDIVESVDSITLHCLEIEITSANLEIAGDSLTGDVTYDEEMQRATISFPQTVPAGEARLDLDFTGTLNDQLHGFYRSSYTDIDGVEQTIATTQFEATDARRAFPCFDEPDMKAVFGITLVVPDHLMAVSNGAEIERLPAGEGRVAVRFSDTMIMSTYLVAFIVGPFEASETIDVDGVPLRVISPKGKGHLVHFALECGEFCLRYLRDYYGIPYPGDKVDMVAVPDFAFGAMENLGCITYRETALLVDPERATQAELLRILDVVAHELAHMWFGDLVTMKWWDGIWLNEAFATFMEMKCTDARRPDWKRWLAFSAVERPWAYGVDALASSRPVEFEVTSPDEANEMFDALTYGKGSSVLRMMEQYLGEGVFRDGVGRYLRRHSYGNTVTRDLWAGLDEASGIDVGSIMDSWILQEGYPQVEVSRVEGGIRLDQRRYLAIPDETDQTLWQIPALIRGESDGHPFEIKVLASDPTAIVQIEGPIHWVLVNAGGHGFYRVSYSEELTKAVRAVLVRLDDNERFALISDAWAFVESGQSSAAAYLEMASAYRAEQEQSIWQSVLGGLGAIRHHIVTDEDLAAYRRVAEELVRPTFEMLGWERQEGDSDLRRRLRGSILGAMGRLVEDPDVIDRSRQVATRWLEDDSGLDPDVAQASLFTMTAHGSPADYERVFGAYRESSDPQTKLKLLQAITRFDGIEFTDQTIAAVRDGRIRSQDASWVVSLLFGGRDSGAHAWKELRRDWEALTALMPPMTLRRLMDGLPALSQPEVAADVDAFFAETPVPVAQKTVNQNVERMRVNAMLREREEASFSQYLRQGSD